MQKLGTCVHIYTQYEVSMSNHVAKRTVHNDSDADSDTNTNADNDGQSMIV